MLVKKKFHTAPSVGKEARVASVAMDVSFAPVVVSIPAFVVVVFDFVPRASKKNPNKPKKSTYKFRTLLTLALK